jgi:hypothetical protein
LVQAKFEVVYQGATSELVDLDGNGIPEILSQCGPMGMVTQEQQSFMSGMEENIGSLQHLSGSIALVDPFSAV